MRKLKKKMNLEKTRKERQKQVSAQTTDCDQDNEVSGDTDEDIDTTEIEEDWIEFLKRPISRAVS